MRLWCACNCRHGTKRSDPAIKVRGLFLWGRLTRPALRPTIMTMVTQFQPTGPSITATQIAFHRTELGPILGLYGRMVAAGEWRDYGISHLSEVAIFSIFKRTAETPIYRIEKRPKLRDKQGQYAVIGMDGRILKRGNDLKAVLRVLERKLIRVVE